MHVACCGLHDVWWCTLHATRAQHTNMRGARCSTQRARCTVQCAPRANQPPTPNRRHWPRRARGRCRSAVGAHRRPCTSPLTVSVPVSIAGLFPSTMSGSVHCMCDAPGISTRNCAYGYQLSRHIGTILMQYRRHCPSRCNIGSVYRSTHSGERPFSRARPRTPGRSARRHAGLSSVR